MAPAILFFYPNELKATVNYTNTNRTVHSAYSMLLMFTLNTYVLRKHICEAQKANFHFQVGTSGNLLIAHDFTAHFTVAFQQSLSTNQFALFVYYL